MVIIMMKRRRIGRKGIIAVTCLLLFISSFISNFKVSKADSMFVQYDCTTWEKTKGDVTYSIDILDKSKTRVSFTITAYSESGRTAYIEVNKSKLSKGKSTFRYTDSWGNMGNGTIYLNKKTVYLKLKETKQDPTALWGIGSLSKCRFKLVSNNFG
jgi:hypothetical protein